MKRLLIGGWLLTAMLAACTPARPTVGPAAAAPTPVIDTAEAVAAVASALPPITSDWRTYTDPEAGYRIRYPPGVHFTAGKSRAGIYTARIQFRIPGVDGYQGMLIRVEPNPAGRGVEQGIDEVYRRFMQAEPPADPLAALEQVMIAGLSGVRMGGEGDFSLVVPYGDRVYIIAPVHDLVTTGIDPQALALFYQVLATLEVQP